MRGHCEVTHLPVDDCDCGACGLDDEDERDNEDESEDAE